MQDIEVNSYRNVVHSVGGVFFGCVWFVCLFVCFIISFLFFPLVARLKVVVETFRGQCDNMS